MDVTPKMKGDNSHYTTDSFGPVQDGLSIGSPRKAARSRFLRATVVIASALLLTSLFHVKYLYSHKSHSTLRRLTTEKEDTRVPTIQDFNWAAVAPSEKLEWTPCYDKFQCARLSVPLDYSKPTGKKAAIAIMKLPSQIPPGDEGYRGPVLFNPGGPGGSGVQFGLRAADLFRTVLGPSYDIISFDPRGVGFTTPGVFTFLSKPEAALFNSHVYLESTLNSSAGALGELYGRSQLLGDITKARTEEAAQHVTTALVARDMLSIVKAYGREKLQYWGFSYGTVLGATFAAMFPDKIERLIIDGVVDSEDYYAALWSNNLRDADAALVNIYQACLEAGPLVCRIHEDSVPKIDARVNTLLEKLRTEPIAFFSEQTGLYGEVTYTIAKLVIFSTLYTPHSTGRALTDALAELEKGNAEPLWNMNTIYKKYNVEDLTCDCPAVPPVPFATDVTASIACSDGNVINATVDDIRKSFEEVAEVSEFAEHWLMHLFCAGWKIRGVERFTGSFVANTSYPLLIIGNTADPVTPLHSAIKMSKGFNNSIVLTQDSPGHCSIAASSSCTMKAVGEYFRDGKLPEPGTVCPTESSIFGGTAGAAMNLHARSDEDRELLKAAEELRKRYPISALGLGGL